MPSVSTNRHPVLFFGYVCNKGCYTRPAPRAEKGIRAAHNSVWHALLLHPTSEPQSMNHARKIGQFLHEFTISSYQNNTEALTVTIINKRRFLVIDLCARISKNLKKQTNIKMQKSVTKKHFQPQTAQNQ